MGTSSKHLVTSLAALLFGLATPTFAGDIDLEEMSQQLNGQAPVMDSKPVPPEPKLATPKPATDSSARVAEPPKLNRLPDKRPEPKLDDADEIEAKFADSVPKPHASPAIPSGLDPVLRRRDEKLFSDLKDIIRGLTTAEAHKVTFPSKIVERALQAELLAHSERRDLVTWVNRRSSSVNDLVMAQDNLALLLDYSTHLLELAVKTKPARRGKRVNEAELKMLAVKYVIDTQNSGASRNRRAIASISNTDLGPIGRSELNRRRRLLAFQVAGDDYRPITVTHFEEYAKKLKETLAAAVTEYDKLAAQITKGAQ